jgi:cyclohexadienyl dehydratase
MRHRRLASITVALLVMALPAAAGTVLDAIHQSGTLRVGTTGDYKPFTFRNADGTYQGADIVMAQRLAAEGGVTILPDRAARGDFTPATYVDGKRPVARCADRDRFVSIAAINRPDVRVVVNPGASNEAFARANFPRAMLTVHADNPTVADEIIAGRADVFVTDGIEVEHIALLHKELCPTAVPALFTRLEKAYWMQRDPALALAVDTWLNGQITSGAWHQTLEAALASP